MVQGYLNGERFVEARYAVHWWVQHMLVIMSVLERGRGMPRPYICVLGTF
jgi:hypothetical protein